MPRYSLRTLLLVALLAGPLLAWGWNYAGRVDEERDVEAREAIKRKVAAARREADYRLMAELQL